MKANALRLAVLFPLLLSAVAFLRPVFPDNSPVAELFMTSSTAIGLSTLAIVWFLYLSNYRYGRTTLSPCD